MVDESGGTHQEAVETAFAVEALDAVENSAHHVVAAGGLATRQDYADIERLLETLRVLVALKLDDGHAIGVWEQFLYLLLVGHGVGGLADMDFHRPLQSLGQLGLIFGPHPLKCTFFHTESNTFIFSCSVLS